MVLLLFFIRRQYRICRQTFPQWRTLIFSWFAGGLPVFPSFDGHIETIVFSLKNFKIIKTIFGRL
ncbi:MAG: hypothetical protein ACYDET_02050 [Thermoleophilia bacterium]